MAKWEKIITKTPLNLLRQKEKILNSDFIEHKLKGVDISKTDLEKNFSYLQVCIDDFNSQAKCTKEKCESKLNGYWNDFDLEENNLVKTIRPCHCLQNKKGNWTSIENISLDTFAKEMQNVNLDNFTPKDKIEEKIKKYITKAINIFPKYSKPLMIIGTEDHIKQIIMSATANQLYEKNPNIAYINLANNLKELDPDNVAKFIVMKQRYKKTQALFIHNVGSEKNNGFTRDFFLYEILRYRLKHKLFTMISSQFSLQWLEQTYSKNNSKIKAEMLINIIKKNYIPIEIKKLSLQK